MPDRDTINAFGHLHNLNEVLTKLTNTELAARQAEVEVQALGERARELEASWGDLADAMAITRQSALNRWGTKRNGAGRTAQIKRLLKLQTKKYGRLNLSANMEFERKFLVSDPSVIRGQDFYDIEQAYLWQSREGYAIRVRKVEARDATGNRLPTQPTLTLKGPREGNGGRVEEEMPLPAEHARVLIDACPHVVRKRRYVLRSSDDIVWEIDEFKGHNDGLYVAEVEGTPDVVALVRRPEWCGGEITHDPRYNNERLAEFPWQTWPKSHGDAEPGATPTVRTRA